MNPLFEFVFPATASMPSWFALGKSVAQPKLGTGLRRCDGIFESVFNA
jgi:hypothetical protein